MLGASCMTEEREHAGVGLSDVEVVVPRVATAAVLVLRLRRVPPAPLVVARQAQAAAALGVVEVRQLVEPASRRDRSRVRGEAGRELVME